MKTNYFISKKISIYSIFGLILVAVTSCGSYQNKSYYDNDGIYDNNQTSKKTTENSESNKYKEYFGSLNKENEEVFTNVENYSSNDDSTNNSAQVEDNKNNYGSWGSNASDNVTVNIYGNNMSGFGYWNNWYGANLGWNSWYGSNWGWNNWGFNNFYGPNWGWNSWYGPSWGFNNWGFNNFYGPNWGWNSGYYNNYNYAHSNGRRNLNGGYNSGAVYYSAGRSSTVSPSIRNNVGIRNVNTTNPTRNNSTRDYNSSSSPRTNTYSNPRSNVNTPRTNQNTQPTRNYNSSSTPRPNTNSNPRTNTNTTPSTPRSYNSPSYTPSSTSSPRSSGTGGSFGGGRSGGRR